MDTRAEDRAWDHRQHLNDDFNSLSNYFLLAQSFLIAVAASAIGGDQRGLLTFTACGLGLSLTAVWAYVQGKQRFLLSLAKKECEEFFPEYRVTRERRSNTLWRFSNTAIQAYVMPGLFAVTWIIFAIAAAI